MLQDIGELLKVDVLYQNWKTIGLGVAGIILFILAYKLKKKRDLKLWTKSNFMDMDLIKKMDGFKFEEYVAGQFINLGLKVKPTPKSGDFGIDVIIEDEYAIQLKNYTNTVGVSAIQEAYAGAAYYGKKPVVMITNYYTKPAIELASVLDVELIDLDDIKNWGNGYYIRSYNHKKGAFEIIGKYLLKDMRIKNK